MKTSLFIMFVLVGCASVAQNSSDIVRIEFSSLTRGYRELMVISIDSITFTKAKAGEAKIEKARACTKEEWADLLKALQKVTMAEIAELKSPTEKRAYDGARHSTITITTPSNVYTHSFDDEEPHQKLMPLMKEIKKKSKN